MKKITQEELIPILTETGIKAKEYADPRSVGTPIEFFLSTIPGGRGILIKKGEKIDLEIATDKHHRQVVLSVHEGKRKITRVVEFSFEIFDKHQPAQYQLVDKAKQRFNMEIPGSKITVSGIKELKREVLLKANPSIGQRSKEKVYYQATVTASVDKESTNHFLMGMDETSHFIAILPQKVESVKEAHKFLKPHGVGAGSKRQGEFFFVPATKKELEKVKNRKVRNSVPLEKGSNHRAQYAIPTIGYKNEPYEKRGHAVYVKGLIFDKRAYRHAPVDLGDVWHKVVRNKEVQTRLNPSRRITRYD